MTIILTGGSSLTILYLIRVILNLLIVAPILSITLLVLPKNWIDSAQKATTLTDADIEAGISEIWCIKDQGEPSMYRTQIFLEPE